MPRQSFRSASRVFTVPRQLYAALGPAIDAQGVFFQDTLNVSERVGETPLLDADGRAVDQRLRMIRRQRECAFDADQRLIEAAKLKQTLPWFCTLRLRHR